MTFDEKFKTEAELLFESKSELEIWNDEYWSGLLNQELIDEIFSCRSNAIQLAGNGVRLSNGMIVRFIIPSRISL